MTIDEGRARNLADQALKYLEETYPELLTEYRKIGPHTFRNLKIKKFLSEYCWVVYASGFRFAVIEAKFPSLQEAFKDFDPESLSRMRSIKAVLEVFNNERKANCFLLGARSIIDEGFSAFKRRLLADGVPALQDLPGIGPITKNHLAKNIGLADVAKPDIWMKRAAELCGTSSVPEFAAYVANYLGESQNVVDVAIWAYAKDGFLKIPSRNNSYA